MSHLRSAIAVLALASPLLAADWPQFMRNAAHTADAADESLRLPLGLLAQVKLEDAVLTSPAVVGGRAYVVDQMGTAYCIDPQAGRIIWKASPEGAAALGCNTSSPCVAQERLYYGTTAGNLHIVDIHDGKMIRTVKVGSPIISAPTFANDAIYFQALDAVLRCLDVNGDERWKWDHYATYKEPPEVTKATERERGHPGSYDRPHYGGGDVAVAGKKVVTSFGWDIVCVEDTGTQPKLVWCNRAPNGRDGTSPMSSSISGDWIYTSGMGADGEKSLTRLSLLDGKVARSQGSRLESYPWTTPAVRGSMVAARTSSDGKNGVLLFDHAARKTVATWRDDRQATPIGCSQALSKDHLLITTLHGELIVAEINGKPGSRPFRFQTPNNKGISSAPVVSEGRVYFGCDDGYLYILAPEGKKQLERDDKLAVSQPRSEVNPATGKVYSWPSTLGNPANTAFVNDADLKPPLRVRWAARGFGHYKAPCVAAGKDVLSVTLTGLVACQEQATGRLRWRVATPTLEWGTSAGLLAADGRVFVPRPTFTTQDGVFLCLDQATGRQLWQAEIGGRYIWENSSPVSAGNRVAFGSSVKGKPVGTAIQCWEADTGQPAWRVELNVAGNRSGSIAGCTDGKVMYFTAGAGSWQWKQEGDKKRGEAVAIEVATGKVLWRKNDVFGQSYPVLTGEQLLLNGDLLHSVAPADGALQWKRQVPGNSSRFSIGPDYIAIRGYGGHGMKIRLADGADDRVCKELGGPTHACGAVALTPAYSFGITVGGLNVRDVKTGELLWQSPGFAPRGCVNAILANGRVFWPSGASGTLFCWESHN